MTYLVVYPQFLGHAGMCHDPLVTITFPLGGYMVDSLTSHMICREGGWGWGWGGVGGRYFDSLPVYLRM